MKRVTKYAIAIGAVALAALLAFVWNLFTAGGTYIELPPSDRAPGAEIVIVDGVVKLNLNLADAEMLQSLYMLNADKATALVEWREANGDFESVEQAINLVAGRSKKTAEDMRAHLIVIDD